MNKPARTHSEIDLNGSENLTSKFGGSTMTTKIQVKEITITRGEGPSSECGKKHVVASYDEAEKVLTRMAYTAPKNGGYDKCDFTVTFADDETYTGRYDLKYDREESLTEHMMGFLEWYAGEAKNPHCGEKKYQEFMSRISPQEIAEVKLFLATYQI
jgi:hypothetical protein